PASASYSLSLPDALPICLDPRARMNVLALNCGSSTVKFRLVAVEPGAAAADGRALAQGTETVHGDDYAGAIGGALSAARAAGAVDRKSTRLNSSHQIISY